LEDFLDVYSRRQQLAWPDEPSAGLDVFTVVMGSKAINATEIHILPDQIEGLIAGQSSGGVSA
jgi:hypothetical protein